MAVTITIKQKESGTGNIHDLASEHFDRDIIFKGETMYAVILAAYYGGNQYTTHYTLEAAQKQSRKVKEFSHEVMKLVAGIGDELRLVRC
jgi:hypothetical protein